MILFRYAAGRMLGASLVALVGVVAIFIAVDVVDHAALFSGAGWGLAALELYACKAAGVVYQLAPAAVLLGAGVATSLFRRTHEYTALRALGLGPWRLALPVVAVTLAICSALVIFHDAVGVWAADRAEELKAFYFGRGGDMSRYLAAREPKRWFRAPDGSRIYHVGATLPGGGFERVTVIELGAGFRVSRWTDADRMRPAGGGWVLERVEDRIFPPDGTMRLERAATRAFAFEGAPAAFSILPGRPTQMRFATLGEQIEARRGAGQPVAEFELERENRLAYPLSALPGALLALALALRRNRKGHVSAALVEAVGVSMLFWAAQAVTWAMGLSGRVSPSVAAWAPTLVFLAVGTAAVSRAR